jgi:hypothetical protein
LMSKLRLVSNLRKPPQRVLEKHLIKQGAADIGTFDKYWAKAVNALQHGSAEQKQKLADLYAATRAKVEEITRQPEAA